MLRHPDGAQSLFAITAGARGIRPTAAVNEFVVEKAESRFN
jgi:hypothetical protein